MNKKFTPKILSCAVKAALLVTMSHAVANDDQQQVTEATKVTESTEVAQVDQDEHARIEHIQVTSRNQSESIDKIPVSVISLSSDEMKKANMQNINDVAEGVVGFSMEKTFGRQSDIPVIRGVSWIPGYGTQKASYFIDGIYYDGSLQSLPMDLVERIEIIKGPQSALYGRRTFSGAINIVTAKPTEQLSGYVSGTIGSYGNEKLGAGVSLPVNDWFALRASVAADNYDGNWENSKQGGPDIGGEKSNSQMLGLYFKPSANTNLDINVIRNETDDEHAPFMRLANDANPKTDLNCYLDTSPYFCGKVPTDLPINIGGVLNNSEYGLRGERTHFSLNLNHAFDFGTLTYMAGYNKYDIESGIDQTYTGAEQVFDFGFFTGGPMFGPATEWHTLSEDNDKEYTHEVRFKSSALDYRLTWSLGAYLWHSEKNTTDRNKFDIEEDNFALMGMVSYDFTDDFKLSLEVRNSTDKIESEAYNQLIQTPEYADLDNKFNSTTTRLIAEYELSSDTMVYVTRSEGNSPAGFNNESGLPPDLVVIEEEEMLMYEAGIKSTLLDNQLYVSAAIYNMDWDNQQLTDTYIADGSSTPNSYTANAGKTEINGLEVELKYLFNDYFDVDVGYALTKAKFVELFDSNQCKLILGPGTAPNKNCVTPEEIREFGSVKGNTPPQVPEHEATLGLNFKAPLTKTFELYARADMNYDSTRYAHVHNLAETGSRTLVNLNIGVSDGMWNVSAWMKNVLDDDTPTYIFRYIDTQSVAFSERAFPVAPSRGREMGITASYSF
ncbi:TonB-dependent receptor [Shewanella glacialipiscicola]|uniref:TonB-dependent receptor n=1 Tax=Shewanella glacialipiscicola TaxID=614069 RepID=UPI003D7B5B0C